MTLRQIIADARSRTHLSAQQRVDLEDVVASACAWSRAGLLSRLSDPCDAPLEDVVRKAADQLSSGKPAEYIMGRAAFLGLQLHVGPGVFVPRPETETLVLLAEQAIQTMRSSEATVLDVCSGSGAIGLALASRLPGIRCIGLDSDAICISCAEASAQEAHLEQRVRFVRANVLSSWNRAVEDLEGHLDLVVSNPPYVREERLVEACLSSPCEPVQALYGGPSGLSFYRRIVAQAHDFLRPGGTLLLEIDDGLEDHILELFSKYGMEDGHWQPDFQGLPRYAGAHRVR